ncbi:MAG: cytochrome C, partial [Bacteroidota bacterium]|nr:cytochrome C [Bacteroidota bacterium]
MKKTVITIILIPIIIFIVVNVFASLSSDNNKLALLKEQVTKEHISSADHSTFEALQKNFKTPQEVTMACQSCHTERHNEVMNSSHWNWEREEFIKGRGVTHLGKKNILNNFCIGIGGSEQSCTRCHAGYNYKDSSFDFTKKENIDCLVCHDGSGEYYKKTGGAGYPADEVNLTEAAQKVGIPQRSNCGACHFYGGGGNNVKHGDLEEAMFACKKDVDVHMAIDGSDMNCTDCHTTEHHNITGQMYSVSSMDKDRVTCEQCHTQTPHSDKILNEHTVKVACQ